MNHIQGTVDAIESAYERRQSIRRADDYFWLQRLCDVTGDGCLVINRDLRIEYSDVRAADHLEIPRETIGAGSDFSDLTLHLAELGYFGPGDPRAFQALFKDLLVNQRMKQGGDEHVLRATTPHGRQIVMVMTYGLDDRFIVVVRDKTDAFVEEQALSTALKVGESGYWLFNLTTREFQMQGGQLLTSGAFGTEKIDNIDTFISLIHKDDISRMKESLAACIEMRKPQTLTFRVVDQSKQNHWIKSHMMPKIDEATTVRTIICFFHDVSSQLRTQDELRSAQERAERALKAKTAFLARLSHEIRTPMNAVIGMADALIHHHDDPAIKPKLTLIQDSAERIIRLVDETLQHTKLEEEQIELDPRDCSPRLLAERICAMWTEQARKSGTSLNLRIDPSVPDQIVFDDFRLEQCLNNVLSNAVKFTESGTIDIILSTAGHSRSNHLIIAVRDTGIGMTEAQQKRVFLPYKQADRSISSRYGGTGLGMSITKDLIELMNGRITVKSEEGRGSLFVITLPIVLPGENAVGSDELVSDLLQTEEAEATDYSEARILIVDDNATNHMVIGSLLQNVVKDTVMALNGEEAIKRLKDSGPFDVVLMDIHMPVMDGIEATLAIRSCHEDYAEVPIIALTADPQYQQARLCKNIGMDEAMAKPVRLISILECFDRVLTARKQAMLEAA
jgi:signal transduction histidine kinase/ActR/RegA family two-component response regulator